MNAPSGPVIFRHLRDGKSTVVTKWDGSRVTLVTVNCGKDFCTYSNGRLVRRTPG